MVWMGWMGWIGWAGWVHRQDRARPRDGTNGIIVCLRIQWAVAVGLFGGWTVLSRLQDVVWGVEVWRRGRWRCFRRAVWGLLQFVRAWRPLDPFLKLSHIDDHQ